MNNEDIRANKSAARWRSSSLKRRLVLGVAVIFLIGALFALRDEFAFVKTLDCSEFRIPDALARAELGRSIAYCSMLEPDSALRIVRKELLSSGFTEAATIRDKRGIEATFTRRSGEFVVLLGGGHKFDVDNPLCQTQIIVLTYKTHWSCGSLR